MRKTNHVPWLGRTVVTAIMVLVGLGVFAGSASAQMSTVYKFADAAAWWASFDCDAMRVILGTIASDGTITKASESSACKMTIGELSRENRRRIENFIEPATAGDGLNRVGPYASTKVWWNENRETTADPATAECLSLQRLVGEVPVPGGTANTDTAITTGDANLYCRAYDGDGGLRPTERDMVDMVGMYLSGQSGMPTDEEEEEAPALPLVGVGILGLLLAGRGAWLRRRS